MRIGGTRVRRRLCDPVRLSIAGALLAVCGGCVETTVTGQSPLLAGLPGVQTGMSGASGPQSRLPQEVAPVAQIRVENEDPDLPPTLYSKTVMDLMRNIAVTMDNNERDLFTDQVLSNMTKQEYYDRGLDPREAFDTLKGMDRDLRKLFSRMPQGEYTPGVLTQPMGQGVTRFYIRSYQGMKLKGIDVVYERRNWRLRWFVPAD